MPHLLVRSIEQEQKIFRIGVIRVPAPVENLRVAFAHLLLKTVVVGGAHYQLDTQFFQLLEHPVKLGFSFRADGRRLVVDR